MDIDIEKLIQVDPLLWAQARKLKVKSGLPYNMLGHAYQISLISTPKRKRNVKKGTQVGVTLVFQLDAIHGLIYKRYPLGVIYMMPSEKQVERFSKVRFTPMFNDNPWLKKHLTVNNVNEKIISSGTLLFVGARSVSVGGTSVKDSAALRTFEADVIDRDEIDLHDEEMVEQSKQRINYSDIRIENNMGSPTYPGYGIDALYEESDQGRWQIKCRSCGKYTCIEDDFPDCVILKDDKWIRSCIHCKSEIFVSDGSWIPLYPDRESAGFWISSFLSPKADLKEYMTRYHNSEGSKLCEFERSILGRASIEAENQLTEEGILGRCTHSMMNMVSTGETAMGVDVGEVIHVVIGIRTGKENWEILRVARVKDFNELHDLVLKMNVKYCVIDAMPDIHATRKFAEEAKCYVYRCHYSERMPSEPQFDTNKKTIKCNRNEMCDKVHDVFYSEKIRIPRVSLEIKEYAYEMTRTAKTIIENPDTGIPKPRWIKLSGGDDHYFHATLYFLLAASRISARQVNQYKVNKNFTKARTNFYL